MKYRTVICDNCKEEFEWKQSNYCYEVSKHHFCNRDCYYEWRKDYHNNPRWNGGEAKMLGYVFVFKPEHPAANSVGYVKRSRVVMEEAIGRYLKPEEVMHHINGIRDDDRLENLMLFENGSQHQRIGHPAKTRKLKQLQPALTNWIKVEQSIGL